MKLASVSVDLDSLQHYCRIHGLPETLLDPRALGLVCTTAVARLMELCARLGVKVTFFAVGEDLLDPASRAALRGAKQAGAEIASHSYAHDYALSRRAEAEIALDLGRAHQAIQEAVGEAPVGFRAPGYALSPALLRAVCAQGYRYDSSVFPSAPYYAAKAVVMGALRLAGRPSRAILDRPRVLAAPRQPYRPDLAEPYQAGQAPLVELPISVSRLFRLPFLGTLAVSAPSALSRALFRGLGRESFLNLELHGVDVLDQEDGLPSALVRRQRELAVPRALKLSRLEELFRWIRDGFQIVTLAQAAEMIPPARGRE